VERLKETLCATVGILGSLIASLFGGFDAAMVTLLIFMAVDYISGLVVAGVFQKSNKTQNGSLESRAGWKGLCRKGMSLLIVLVAVRLDITLGTNYIRDGVCIAFITNEVISIVENAGLMGVPIPSQITKAIEVLKGKEESEEEDNE
jgi:toxin secretion/phage lysis holin